MNREYAEKVEVLLRLIQDVCALMTPADQSFLVSFEQGQPDWDSFDFGYFQEYPSIQWKLLNLQKLKRQTPVKLTTESAKLQAIFSLPR